MNGTMRQAEQPRRRKRHAAELSASKGAQPLVMLALYDAVMARLAEDSGVDLILVGDSVGTVMLGFDSTSPVTLDQIIHHAAGVRRGAPKTHIVADLPFMTYQVSDEQAVASAGRLLKEAGVDAVKLEGGAAMASRIAAITRAGIPVMGHIGLLPQTASAHGGYRVQGRDIASARQMLDDARAVEAAGAYALVMELVPYELAAKVTESVGIPTIGIGAGAACDGQVLVSSDLLGMDPSFQPRFLKKYANLAETIHDAFAAYASDVRERAYPGPEHVTTLPAETLAALHAPEPVE
jgi:3-methyl-2-oxobutanoate hydroxymethyltransferase